MEQDSAGYQILLKAAYRLAGERPTDTLAAELFKTVQWALASRTAASLAQMAARSAAGSPQLAELVREHQDLVGEWEIKDKLLVAAKSEAPDKRQGRAGESAHGATRSHRHTPRRDRRAVRV